MIDYLLANSTGTAAIGAGIAIGLCGISAGLSEAGIGKAVIKHGLLDKEYGKGLIMTSIGESVVIYGFVIALIIVLSMVQSGVF